MKAKRRQHALEETYLGEVYNEAHMHSGKVSPAFQKIQATNRCPYTIFFFVIITIELQSLPYEFQ